MDQNVAVELQEFIVYRALGINQAGIAQQAADPIQHAQRLQSVRSDGHVVYGVLVAENPDHPIIKDLEESMGDPVVRVRKIGLIQFQPLQEGPEGAAVALPDVQEQRPCYPAADLPFGGRFH